MGSQFVNCRVDVSFNIDLEQPFATSFNESPCELFLIKRLFGLD
ncbi:MAG: hypothetical protein ACREUF_05255 [Solimonas sp.]